MPSQRATAFIWRSTPLALCLNFFVLVVLSFEKVPALKELAPTQSEPPFLFTQLAVLALFLAFGSLSTIGFRRAAAHAA